MHAPAMRAHSERPSAFPLSTSKVEVGSRRLELSSSQTTSVRADSSWRLQDIDWRFCFRAQHYGTAFFAVFIVITLGIVHWAAHPAQRPFFLYDVSISYVSPHGDTVPAAAAVLCPFASLIISLVAFEFFIYKGQNQHITNAAATLAHFLLDCVCAFATVECFTEITKMCAGRLRPDFLEICQPDVHWQTGVAMLGQSLEAHCTTRNADGRKSFCSGHASSSSVIAGYNIVYLIWAGYIRGGDTAFLGLDKKTGWRAGHRLLRELGHGLYLIWILLNFTFVWAVGISRFTDNKHNISDVLGGWILGFAFAVVYATRSMSLHKYVIMHIEDKDISPRVAHGSDLA